jgi:ribonuclease HII
MCELHERWPAYDFAAHKGYVTPEHSAALDRHGPCPEHRRSYVNVARAAARGVAPIMGDPAMGDNGDVDDPWVESA